MKRNGWDVHVCCLTRGGPRQEMLDAAGVPVTIIGKSWKIDPPAYFRLKSYIADLKPDLVHTWLFAANSYGRHAALACGVKHVLAGERCVDPWKGWHELAIDRHLARRTERIVTNSSGVQDFYVKNGLPSEKFVVIPNGIAPVVQEPATREQVLQELGLDIPAGEILVGAVGRLWPQKRTKDLIWALDLIRCLHEKVHLLIMGDGPQRWRLERYARQVTEGDFVHFLGERNDVPRILPHLACLWLASAYEGQSNAIMEAMAAGIPVIATNIPGNRDLVVPGQTGELVEVGDRAGFAGRLREWIENPELGKQLGAAGRERIEREFSVEAMVARHEGLYRELLGI